MLRLLLAQSHNVLFVRITQQRKRAAKNLRNE